MEKPNKTLLLSVEKKARKQNTFTMDSLEKEFPPDEIYKEAIKAFFESSIVNQTGVRGRCVPAGQRGGIHQYRDIDVLLKKGYTVYVELTDLNKVSGYPMPGAGMRAKIEDIVEFRLPEPEGLPNPTFNPVISFTLNFSGFDKYNKYIDSLIKYPQKVDEINTVSLMNSEIYPDNGKIQLEIFGTMDERIMPFKVIGVTCCR